MVVYIPRAEEEESVVVVEFAGAPQHATSTLH